MGGMNSPELGASAKVIRFLLNYLRKKASRSAPSIICKNLQIWYLDLCQADIGSGWIGFTD